MSNYINSAVKNDLECLKFGHKWQARYNDFRFDDNGCPECYLLNSRGENSPHWNHELTNEDRENSSNRNRDPNTRLWVKAVLDRDNHTCQCCNSRRSLTLIAHHIDSWKEFKSDRFNVDNGVTLCENCHKAYHKRWGKDKANHNSFYFWMAEQSTVNPSKWLWSVRYFESMNEWLEYFKRQLI